MNLYVGNISFTVTEDDLKSLFEDYGTVSSVKIVKDRDTGQPRGFAFVEMSTAEEGQKAISELDGKQHEGRNLKVNEARPPEKRDNNRRPGGGGGRGFGGGGFSR